MKESIDKEFFSEKQKGLNRALQDLVDEFLQTLQAMKYSPMSLQSYRLALRQFLFFLAAELIERIQDVTERDLARYRLILVDRGMRDTSVAIYLRRVRSFFRHLEKRQIIFGNPAQYLTLPRCAQHLQSIPTERQVAKLLAQPDPSTPAGVRDRALLEVAYSTGARLDELVRMDVFDPDLKAGLLRVQGKGRKERVLPLGRQAVFWLGQYLEQARPKLLKEKHDEHALWVGWHGRRRMHRITINYTLRDYSRQARLSPSLTPHSLRRACATHMLQHGAHPLQLQLLLGHASLKTLSHYLRLSIADLRKMHKKTKLGR